MEEWSWYWAATCGQTWGPGARKSTASRDHGQLQRARRIRSIRRTSGPAEDASSEPAIAVAAIANTTSV